MTDQDYLDASLEADKLRRQAEADDLRAAEVAEANPMYADYLARRADHRRYLANDMDGGAGK